MGKGLDNLIKVICTPQYFLNKIEEAKKEGQYGSNEFDPSYFTDKKIAYLLDGIKDAVKNPFMKIINIFSKNKSKNTKSL